MACGAAFALVGLSLLAKDPGSINFGSVVFAFGTWAIWTAVRAGVSVVDGVVERRAYLLRPKRVAVVDVVGVRVVSGDGGSSEVLTGTCQPELILANGDRLTLTPLARYATLHGAAAVNGDAARLAEALGVGEDSG